MPTTGAVPLYLPIPEGLTGKCRDQGHFQFLLRGRSRGCDQLHPGRSRHPVSARHHADPAALLQREQAYYADGAGIRFLFSAKNFYATEHMQRDDAQKWETTLTRAETKRASSLAQPSFDVSYITREHGHDGRRPANMKFALALTIRNRSARDIYDRVIVSSGNRLQPMRPRAGVQVPIRLPK